MIYRHNKTETRDEDYFEINAIRRKTKINSNISKFLKSKAQIQSKFIWNTG